MRHKNVKEGARRDQVSGSMKGRCMRQGARNEEKGKGRSTSRGKEYRYLFGSVLQGRTRNDVKK